MREIQFRDAKTNLSTIINDAVDGKPVVILRHGKKQAVVVSYDEWLRLSKVPNVLHSLMASPLRASDLLPRIRARSRKIDL